MSQRQILKGFEMTAVSENQVRQWFENILEVVVKPYFETNFPPQWDDQYDVTVGKKYAKVIRHGSVWCFVNLQNGDILKPASWKAPAKHARGNIFQESGIFNMGPYGPAYLRG